MCVKEQNRGSLVSSFDSTEVTFANLFSIVEVGGISSRAWSASWFPSAHESCSQRVAWGSVQNIILVSGIVKLLDTVKIGQQMVRRM